MHFAVEPLSLIVFSVWVDHSSLGVCLIVAPVALVKTVVWPDLLPLPVSHSIHHFPYKFGPVRHHYGPDHFLPILLLVNRFAELEIVAVLPQLATHLVSFLTVELLRLQKVKSVGYELRIEIGFGATVFTAAAHGK